MDDCGYYRIINKFMQDRSIRADRMARGSTVKLPWCAHPTDSPVDQRTVQSVIGGARLLTCGGDLGKCPIADKL